MAEVKEQVIADLLAWASNKKTMHYLSKKIHDIVERTDLGSLPTDDPAIQASGLTRAELIALYQLASDDITELEANDDAKLKLVLKADAARQD